MGVASVLFEVEQAFDGVEDRLDGSDFLPYNRCHPQGGPVNLLSDATFAGEGIQRRVVCEVGDWGLFLELVSAWSGTST